MKQVAHVNRVSGCLLQAYPFQALLVCPAYQGWFVQHLQYGGNGGDFYPLFVIILCVLRLHHALATNTLSSPATTLNFCPSALLLLKAATASLTRFKSQPWTEMPGIFSGRESRDLAN